MPPRNQPSPKLEQLKQLSGAAQTALAIEIVAAEKDVRAVRAALTVLTERPTPAARTALISRFEQLMADGVKRDAGTYLRAAMLAALRPVALPEDGPMLEQAARTYEFLPPTRSEEAHQLRSAALVVLNEIEPRLAGLQAVRLLADPHTSRLSGEPALTAARLLAAQEQVLPLYYYALHQAGPQSEVLAECLKSLAGLPEAAALDLVEQHGASEDEVVLVGVVDLALEFEPVEWVQGFMRSTSKYAVYHYLVTRLAGSHAPRWRGLLAEAAAHERDERKLGLIEEALSLGRADPVLGEALATVRQRRAGRAL
jgi:hypothetical protein